MKQTLCSFALALLLGLPVRGQSIFDSSQVHVVNIISLYNGLQDTLTSDYILSFDFFQHQIRDIPYTYCKIELDGTLLDTIGIRHKGFNSWWSSPKKPMKLDLNRFKKGQNYQGLKKLNLHNRAGDPTFLRENLSYELLRKMGIPAPRTSFARVYFDGQYAGLYRLVEQVDNEFLDAHFGDHKGNLYKQNSSGSAGYNLEWLGSQQENYYPQYEPENHNNENNWSTLVHFVDVLNNTPDQNFVDSIVAVFDVESFLRVLALDYAVNNLDFYANSGRNYYLYHDAGGDGKIHWLPWDYNLSWREDAPPVDPDPSVSPVLIRRLLNVPQFRQMFWEQYCVLRQYFDYDKLTPRMETDSALIQSWVAVDSSGDFSLDAFQQNISNDWFNLPGLKLFVNKRSNEIDPFLAARGVDCSLVVDVDNPPAEVAALHIFPNPARQDITLQWPESFAAETKQLMLFDALGHLVREEKVPAGGITFNVNLGSLQTGVYFIRVVTGKASITGTVVLGY